MKTWLPACLWLLGCALPVTAWEGVLRLPGLPGDATLQGHENWITIKAVGCGLSKANQGAPAPSRVMFNGLVVSKNTDVSSPQLAVGAASGRTFPYAQVDLLEARAGQPAVFYQILLTNVTIIGFSQAGAATALNETVTLTADRVAWKTFQFRADGASAGSVGALWDFVRQSGHELGALRLTAIQIVGASRYQLEWTSSPGGIYDLLGSDQLGGTETLITTVTATNSLTRTTVTPAPTVPKGFYRVRQR